MQVSKSNKLANVCYDIRGPVLKHAKRLEEAGDRILKLKPSDVAVAVAIEGGLFTPVLKDAQQKWEKLRDADCAVDTFPAVTGTKAYAIAHNDCLARMSDERSEFLESIGQE